MNSSSKLLFFSTHVDFLWSSFLIEVDILCTLGLLLSPIDYRYFLSAIGNVLSSSEIVSSLLGEMRLFSGVWYDQDFLLSMDNFEVFSVPTGMSTISSYSPISKELIIS